MQLNILITHVSYQASVSFIKMLRACKGYNIHICGCSKIEKGYTCGSMLVDKFFVVPHSNEEEYLDQIKNICEEEKISLILTAEEQDLIIFKTHKVPEALYQYIPDIDLFSLFQDKYLATTAINHLGVKTPKILFKASECENINYFIRRKRVSCASRGIKMYRQNELSFNEPLFCEDYITQPVIAGDEYTVDVFCDKNGRPIMIMPRIRLATKDGTTVRCIIKNDTEIINVCKKIYKNYKLPGISNIQFIKQGNDVYFIELNPRAAAACISTLRATGINWMELYINAFLNNQPLNSLAYYQKKIHWNTVISRYYEETVMFGESNE